MEIPQNEIRALLNRIFHWRKVIRDTAIEEAKHLSEESLVALIELEVSTRDKSQRKSSIIALFSHYLVIFTLLIIVTSVEFLPLQIVTGIIMFAILFVPRVGVVPLVERQFRLRRCTFLEVIPPDSDDVRVLNIAFWVFFEPRLSGGLRIRAIHLITQILERLPLSALQECLTTYRTGIHAILLWNGLYFVYRAKLLAVLERGGSGQDVMVLKTLLGALHRNVPYESAEETERLTVNCLKILDLENAPVH